jgi:sulfur carrier protein
MPRPYRRRVLSAAGVAGPRARISCHVHASLTPVIALTVNGETHRFESVLSVAELVERLALTGKRIALERNGEIVPRSRFADERLADGDRLEIVVAVGGG